MLKNTRTNESGRSMVEMLGVLAIIGVLSVGGIAGYTFAMNKHRANELLHQVSMRSVSCMAQLAQGNTTLSIDDFGDYDGYSFSPSYNTTDKTYSITVTGLNGKTISEAVCNNMKNAVPSDVIFETTCGVTNASVKLIYRGESGDATNTASNCFISNNCSSTTCDAGETWHECYHSCLPSGSASFLTCGELEEEGIALEDAFPYLTPEDYANCRKQLYPPKACDYLGWAEGSHAAVLDAMNCIKNGGDADCCTDKGEANITGSSNYEDCFTQ